MDRQGGLAEELMKLCQSYGGVGGGEGFSGGRGHFPSYQMAFDTS